MIAGLLAKAALFPLHLWLPPAHAGAPAAASAVLSALVIKAPFFLILRLVLRCRAAADAAQRRRRSWPSLGAAAILFCSVWPLRQARLKLMIAYSTVAQIGYLFLDLPAGRRQRRMPPWATDRLDRRRPAARLARLRQGGDVPGSRRHRRGLRP